MNIIETLNKLRQDIQTWTGNNLRALNDKKLDKTTAEENYVTKEQLNTIDNISYLDAGKIIES